MTIMEPPKKLYFHNSMRIKFVETKEFKIILKCHREKRFRLYFRDQLKNQL